MENSNERFNFFLPIDIEKGKIDKKTGKKVMKISGIASTNDVDTDNEILEPEGFDLSHFMNSGFINYNHNAKSSPKAIVGEPTEGTRIENNKLIVEGTLYDDNPLSHEIYNLAETLKKSGSKRRLGFSIEGKPLMKDPINPKRITKAIISGVAITPCPKNHNTVMDIVKGDYEKLYVSEYDFDFDTIEKSENGGEIEYIIDIFDKGCGTRVRMDKNFNIKVEKGLTTAQDSGRGLIKEDVEQKGDKVYYTPLDQAVVTVVEGNKIGLVPDKVIDQVKLKLGEK